MSKCSMTFHQAGRTQAPPPDISIHLYDSTSTPDSVLKIRDETSVLTEITRRGCTGMQGLDMNTVRLGWRVEESD